MKNKYATIGIIATTVILAGVAIFTALRLYQTRTQPVAPNAPSSKPKAAGITCGGIAGIACPSGEECIYSDGTTHAPNPDASGTCQVSSNKNICSLSFAVVTPSPTPTPTKTPTPTPTKTPSPTPSASPTPVPQCNTACSTSSQCPSGLTCYIPNGQVAGNCRKSTCTTETDCVCATATPTASPTPTATAATVTPTPTRTPTASPVAQCNSNCTSNSNCPSSMMCYIASGATSGNCRNSQCLSETDCTCAVVTNTPTSTPTYVAVVPTEVPSLPNAGTSWPTILGTGFGLLVIIGSLLLAL